MWQDECAVAVGECTWKDSSIHRGSHPFTHGTGYDTNAWLKCVGADMWGRHVGQRRKTASGGPTSAGHATQLATQRSSAGRVGGVPPSQRLPAAVTAICTHPRSAVSPPTGAGGSCGEQAGRRCVTQADAPQAEMQMWGYGAPVASRRIGRRR